MKTKKLFNKSLFAFSIILFSSCTEKPKTEDSPSLSNSQTQIVIEDACLEKTVFINAENHSLYMCKSKDHSRKLSYQRGEEITVLRVIEAWESVNIDTNNEKNLPTLIYQIKIFNENETKDIDLFKETVKCQQGLVQCEITEPVCILSKSQFSDKFHVPHEVSFEHAEEAVQASLAGNKKALEYLKKVTELGVTHSTDQLELLDEYISKYKLIEKSKCL